MNIYKHTKQTYWVPSVIAFHNDIDTSVQEEVKDSY